LAIDQVVARSVGAREFSLPALGPALPPAGVAVEVGVAGLAAVFVLGDPVDDGFVDFVVVEERQFLRPPGVKEVVVFGGRPRWVFTGPELVSFRCTNSRRSARRCAASAFVIFSSSCLIRACSPVASGLGSPSEPGASASSIALIALVSS
jgi:hypothetical protein